MAATASLVPAEAERHASVQAAWLAATAAEAAGYQLAVIGYGSLMGKKDAERTLSWRPKDKTFLREMGIQDADAWLADPIPVRVQGLHRILSASDSRVQPAPPNAPRVFEYIDIFDKNHGRYHDDLRAALGVRAHRGRTCDATAQLVTAGELAALGGREVAYRLRLLPQAAVHGYVPLEAGAVQKPLLFAYFEPLPQSLWARHSQKRLVNGKLQKAEVRISTEYRDTVVRAPVAKLVASTDRIIDGTPWNPLPEIDQVVKEVPEVALQIRVITPELIARYRASGLIGRDQIDELSALLTPEGHQAALSKTDLPTYMVGAAFDLRTLNIPTGPAIDAAAPPLGKFSPERERLRSDLV